MSTVFIIICMVSVLAFAVALVRPKTFSRKGATPSRAKAAGSALLMAVISFIGAGVSIDYEKSGSTTSTEAKTSDTTQDSAQTVLNPEEIIIKFNNKLEKVSEIERVDGSRTLNLDIYVKDSFSDAWLITAVATDSQKILEQITKEFPDRYALAHFNIYTDIIDQYNNTAKGHILGITFDMTEIQKLNFKNLPYQRLLNGFVTKVSGGPIGKQVTYAWCSNTSNRNDAPAFCKMAGHG